MKFVYKAKTKQGELQEGVVEASSREAAIDVLQRNNLIILRLESEKEAPLFTRRIKLFERVKSKDMVIFSRQLSTLFSAKVPLIESLQVLTAQTTNPLLRDIILGIAKELEGGMALSQAMSKYPKVFSKFYVSMIKSGEISGKLEEVLNYLADSLERQHSLATKVFNALIYPAIISIVFLAVGIAMFIIVVPQLKNLVLESGQELPLPTKIIFGFSNFLISYGVYLLIVLVIGGFVGSRYFLRTPSGRLMLDGFLLRVPIFGVLFQKISLTRFADSLSTLISGGLPIVEAIEVTSDVVANRYYKDIFLNTAGQVKKGFPMSSVLKVYPNVIPPMVSQMVFVGEETGRLEEILRKVADFYEEDTKNTLDTLVSLIEPLMIIVLAGFVFILVAAILLPIYRIAGGI